MTFSQFWRWTLNGVSRTRWDQLAGFEGAQRQLDSFRFLHHQSALAGKCRLFRLYGLSATGACAGGFVFYLRCQLLLVFLTDVFTIVG